MLRFTTAWLAFHFRFLHHCLAEVEQGQATSQESLEDIERTDLSEFERRLRSETGPQPPDALSGWLGFRLEMWLGKKAFAETKSNYLYDDQMSGYNLSSSLGKHVKDVMWMVIHRHSSRESCTTLPRSIATHAWRYNQSELQQCMGLDGKSSKTCMLSCSRLPEVKTMLTCSHNSVELSGEAVQGSCAFQPAADVINTTGGLVRGLIRPIPWLWSNGTTIDAMTRTYWGIPYAAEAKRFEVARPLTTRWEGVRSIDYLDHPEELQKIHCAGAPPMDRGRGIEDCLFLDVYAPPGASADSLRPVWVWLFAGGFAIGDAWQKGRTDAARLAVQDDVVVVIVSSRTAMLGHWAHPALTQEYGDGSAGNIGERDQRQALKWIQANMRAFGGDPDQVTLAGHSSGAFDTVFHLASPGSRSLFSGAVLESAAVDSAWYWQSKQEAFDFYGVLGEAMGCPKSHDRKQVDCLRSLPVDTFANFSHNQTEHVMKRSLKVSSIPTDLAALFTSVLSALFGSAGNYTRAGLNPEDMALTANPLWPLLPFGPVVDGTQEGLPTDMRSLYEAGEFQDVPLYINQETDEGTIFAFMLVILFPWQASLSASHSAVNDILKWALGANDKTMESLLQLYPRGTSDDAPLYRLSQVIGDLVFTCPARRFAAAGVSRGQRIFFAEHTWKGSQVKSTSAASAILHGDFGYFLGANHALPTMQVFGRATLGGGALPGADAAKWEGADQKNFNIMHCHYALMFHCRDVGAEPGSNCRKELARRNITLHSCEVLEESEIAPFGPYDPKTGLRHRLDPLVHTPILPSDREQKACEFWDAAPARTFQPNRCYGCHHRAVFSNSVDSVEHQQQLVIV